MLKIRRPLGRLIFNMGIAIPGKTVFLIETAPRPQYQGMIWLPGSWKCWWEMEMLMGTNTKRLLGDIQSVFIFEVLILIKIYHRNSILLRSLLKTVCLKFFGFAQSISIPMTSHLVAGHRCLPRVHIWPTEDSARTFTWGLRADLGGTQPAQQCLWSHAPWDCGLRTPSGQAQLHHGGLCWGREHTTDKWTLSHFISYNMQNKTWCKQIWYQHL